ncbi:hypothetical protein CYMTET_29889 [Cymbomonas tetramitiformis]|uniref:Integrase zinc-binding domain-containing protein n=1 Tax=Cymbomonas tetramitiformis TaxID=36881 RepID=A0AAE0FK64_9CHLO|nr:hypothetical protein CYMTET_29889 [Cymbomonas tetramitiformis]
MCAVDRSVGCVPAGRESRWSTCSRKDTTPYKGPRSPTSPSLTEPLVTSGPAAKACAVKGPLKACQFVKELGAEYDRSPYLKMLKEELLTAPHQRTASFRMVDDMIRRVVEGRYQLVLSSDSPLRELVPRETHEVPISGHIERDKTLDRVVRSFWWPRMAQDVTDWTRSCFVCQHTRPRNSYPVGQLSPPQGPVRLWQVVGIDFVTGLPRTEHVYDAFATFKDKLSKMVYVVPMMYSNSSAEQVDATHLTRPGDRGLHNKLLNKRLGPMEVLKAFHSEKQMELAPEDRGAPSAYRLKLPQQWKKEREKIRVQRRRGETVAALSWMTNGEELLTEEIQRIPKEKHDEEVGKFALASSTRFMPVGGSGREAAQLQPLPNKPTRILVLFCGTGSVEREFSKQFPGCELITEDILSKWAPVHCEDILRWDYRQYVLWRNEASAETDYPATHDHIEDTKEGPVRLPGVRLTTLPEVRLTPMSADGIPTARSPPMMTDD